MFFAFISSDKYKSLNGINEVPFIGSLLVFVITLMPTVIIQYLVELLFGKIPAFDLGLVFWFNTFFIHLFILICFKIKIKLFFLPSYISCSILMLFNLTTDFERISSYF